MIKFKIEVANLQFGKKDGFDYGRTFLKVCDLTSSWNRFRSYITKNVQFGYNLE